MSNNSRVEFLRNQLLQDKLSDSDYEIIRNKFVAQSINFRAESASPKTAPSPLEEIIKIDFKRMLELWPYLGDKAKFLFFIKKEHFFIESCKHFISNNTEE
jgi:hypothetical protein